MYDLQEYKKKLDDLSGIVLKAYLDSAVFISIVKLANDTRRTSNFLFSYSYYAIRNRAIISAKSIIERAGKNRLTLDTIIKELQKNEKYKKFADELHIEYNQLFDSEGAKRVKGFRDTLCHNINDDSEKMLYCKDIMAILNVCMNILQDIYKELFNTINRDFFKIQHLSATLADDYWAAICEQSDKVPNRHKELAELQRIFNGKK